MAAGRQGEMVAFGLRADCGAMLGAWASSIGSCRPQRLLPPGWHHIAAYLQPLLHFFVFRSTGTQSQRSRLNLKMGKE